MKIIVFNGSHRGKNGNAQYIEGANKNWDKLLSKVIELNPDNEIAKNNLETIEAK